MSSAALWALALALLCVAGAFALWRRGEANRERAHAARYIDSRLEPGARAEKPAEGLARWRERAADAWLNVSNRAGVSEIRAPLAALAATT
ncbi:pilus assembly protein, partial [Burkholderia mallei]|nr:pilus assembly protein [Burkholderia mallei]